LKQDSSKIEMLNDALVCALGMSPLDKKKLRSKVGQEEKVEEIAKKTVDLVLGCDSKQNAKKTSVDSLILAELVPLFHSKTSSSDKISLLTVAAAAKLPITEIVHTFGTTEYMARKAIELHSLKGILARPEPKKSGNALTSEVVESVKRFYLRDSVSKQLPGKCDNFTVKVNGEKTIVQKRLLLQPLKFLHELYKEDYPLNDIGFTKFSSLRPRECVFPTSARTFSQCMCLLHTNPSLLLESIDLAKMTESWDKPLRGYADCIALMQCQPASEECHLRTCPHCPSVETLKNLLFEVISATDIESVTFHQWLTGNRSCSLEKLTKNVQEFVDLLAEQLEKLSPHSYIVKKQAEFVEQTQNSLKEGEVMLFLDFSENYTLQIQNAVQSYYWHQKQATVHVAVAVYKQNDKICTKNYVSLSDYLKHDTAAVHLYMSKVIAHIKNDLPFIIHKMFYVSDGCSGQYKNKFSLGNVLRHRKEYGIDAEWHFQGTAHGKSICDAIGGITKSVAFRATHQKSAAQQMTNAKELFEFLSERMKNVTFDLVDEVEHKAHKRELQEVFAKCKPIPGCRSFHAFIPDDAKSMNCKRHSMSSQSKCVKCF